MEIKQVKAWQTSDGTYHSTRSMAEQFVKNADLVTLLDEIFVTSNGQDILNFLSGHRSLVREWLDACDAMEKEVMS